MQSNSMESFFLAVLQNPELQEKFKEADTPEKAIDLAVRLGHENGYNFTLQDVKEFLKNSGGNCDELNEESRQKNWAMFSLIRIGCIERMRQYEAQKENLVVLN